MLELKPDPKLERAQISLASLVREASEVTEDGNDYVEYDSSDEDSDDSNDSDDYKKSQHGANKDAIGNMIGDLARYVECLAETSNSLDQISTDYDDARVARVHQTRLSCSLKQSKRPGRTAGTSATSFQIFHPK